MKILKKHVRLAGSTMVLQRREYNLIGEYKKVVSTFCTKLEAFVSRSLSLKKKTAILSTGKMNVYILQSILCSLNACVIVRLFRQTSEALTDGWAQGVSGVGKGYRLKDFRPSDKFDNHYLIIPWVTNDNSEHLCALVSGTCFRVLAQPEWTFPI